MKISPDLSKYTELSLFSALSSQRYTPISPLMTFDFGIVKLRQDARTLVNDALQSLRVSNILSCHHTLPSIVADTIFVPPLVNCITSRLFNELSLTRQLIFRFVRSNSTNLLETSMVMMAYAIRQCNKRITPVYECFRLHVYLNHVL